MYLEGLTQFGGWSHSDTANRERKKRTYSKSKSISESMNKVSKSKRAKSKRAKSKRAKSKSANSKGAKSKSANSK